MTFPTVTAALDRRLAVNAEAPLAVGFSGGGDSLALLILTLDWARVHGRSVLALTVDHRLNPASAAWTADAVAKAQALGAAARALAWTGDKPATGLPAAARGARHALLAQAARQAGAKVLLLGHTRDDLAEAAAMRAQGSTVSDPRDWAPSPVWPEGRSVFVLRPLLAVGRDELRSWLRARGETWLDDPANEDPTYARAQARRLLATRFPSPWRGEGLGGGAPPPAEAAAFELHPDALPPPSPTLPPSRGKGDAAAGYLTLLRDAPAAHIAAACLCAAGTAQPPRGERLARLAARIRAGEAFTATLAGARIEATGPVVRLYREPGEARRGGLSPVDLPVGQPMVWDGRYELVAEDPGLTVRPLQGLAARLPPAQRQALKALPPAARAPLPAVVDAAGTVTCPILAGAFPARARCLVGDRFDAAIGLVDQEPAT
ncbi:tRNA lysidine(34) synthetase TilS [Caulobacter sp. LARHSG274]